MVPIDFEDLAWGYPIQDIATTLSYFDNPKAKAAYWGPFKSGYSRYMPWPEEFSGQIETHIHIRDTMLANYVVSSKEPEDQAFAPGYVERLCDRLSVWLETE